MRGGRLAPVGPVGAETSGHGSRVDTCIDPLIHLLVSGFRSGGPGAKCPILYSMGFRTRTAETLARLLTRHRVMAGPFKGLRYVDDSVSSVYGAKLLGVYEKELHPVIEQLIADAPDRVIDVGAAEGYYAVGMAYRLRCPVFAFERDEKGRALLLAMARLNDVDGELAIEGECSPAELQAAMAAPAHPLVIMDVEGAESTLMDPKKLPASGKTKFLIEVHEGIVPGLVDLIRSRFAPTHDIRVIEPKRRSMEDLPLARRGCWRWIPQRIFLRMMDEKRARYTPWFLMEPRH